jgi:hypothetical protein
MLAGFERYFLRGERYALISYTAEGGGLPGACDRKRIAEWANQPRVRALSARLCVGSAPVVQSALMRGTMTALLWFWEPACPLRLATTPTEAIDWCLDRLEEEGVSVPRSRANVHESLQREVFI